MALTHQIAVAQLAAAGQPERPERPKQITLGLAARFMTLHLRQSTAFDRHRTAKARAAERAAERTERAERRAAKKAAAAEDEPQGGFLVVPEQVPLDVWTRMVKVGNARRMAGILPTEEERAIHRARYDAAIAEAVARGQTSGTVEVPFVPELDDPAYKAPPEGAAGAGAAKAEMDGMPPWADFGETGTAEPPPRPPP